MPVISMFLLIGFSGSALAEPTELEYLRNILYEYMMGNQTQVRNTVRLVCALIENPPMMYSTITHYVLRFGNEI